MMYKESSRKKRASKSLRKELLAMEANRMIERAIENNDEVRLVLEVAARAHEMESREQPLDIFVPTETVVIMPIPALLGTLGCSQTA